MGRHFLGLRFAMFLNFFIRAIRSIVPIYETTGIYVGATCGWGSILQQMQDDFVNERCIHRCKSFVNVRHNYFRCRQLNKPYIGFLVTKPLKVDLLRSIYYLLFVKEEKNFDEFRFQKIIGKPLMRWIIMELYKYVMAPKFITAICNPKLNYVKGETELDSMESCLLNLRQPLLLPEICRANKMFLMK